MIDTDVRDKLSKILDIIQNKNAYEHIQPKGSDGIIELGYYVYDDSLYLLEDIIGRDYDYIENFKRIKNKAVENLNKKELATLCTHIFRGERFYDGSIAVSIDDGIIERMIKRYLEVC